MRNDRFTISSVRSWLRNRIPDFTGLLRVKAGLPLLLPILQVGRVVVGTLNPSWVKVSYVFARSLANLYRSQGVPGVVKHLKVASVILQQAAAGYRIKDLTELGPRLSRTGTGLPRIIPHQQRQRILAGDSMCIRFWLSLFSIYRVLEFPGIIKTSTITSPGVNLSKFEKGWNSFLDSGFSALIRSKAPFDSSLIETFKLGSSPHPILKTSPTSEAGTVSTAWSSVVEAARRIYVSESMLSAVRAYALATNNSWVIDRIVELGRNANINADSFGASVGALGKLGLKQEPAGKVRVFAMVDPWTQWLLAPLHKRVFSILRRIPQDGTFNQVKPVERLLESGRKRFWSYDLSAATDRLPVSLQAQILDRFFGQGFGSKWSRLLVDRDYLCPDRMPGMTRGRVTYTPLRYAVGQPMGALSSWAMLALTHHALVQYAAFRVGRRDPTVRKGLWRVTWFEWYAVLGDDIVIADGRVAREYLRVMSEVGVSVGLAKSLVSPRGATLEFAKRFWYRGSPASPVSFLELAVARLSVSALAEFSRKWDLSYASVLSLLGYRHRVLGGIHKGYHRLSGRITSVLWMVARKRYSFVQWLTLDSVEPRFDSRFALEIEKSTNWAWSLLEPVLIRWIVDSLQRRIRSLERSLTEMLKWAGEGCPNDALRQWITAHTVEGSLKLVSVDKKVSAITDNASGSYSPVKLLAEWEVLWRELAQVSTVETISDRLPDDEDDPMVEATLVELKLLRQFKAVSKSVREPLSLKEYVNNVWDWATNSFVVQLLRFIGKVVGLREVRKSIIRNGAIWREGLIQSMNFGFGLIVGWFLFFTKRSPSKVEGDQPWIDFFRDGTSGSREGAMPLPDSDWWVWVAGGTIFIVSLAVWYWGLSVDSTVEEVVKPLTAVERFQTGVSGPYSIHEWREVQDYLAIVAWEENLALSPVAGQTAIDWLTELPL